MIRNRFIKEFEKGHVNIFPSIRKKNLQVFSFAFGLYYTLERVKNEREPSINRTFSSFMRKKNCNF